MSRMSTLWTRVQIRPVRLTILRTRRTKQSLNLRKRKLRLPRRTIILSLNLALAPSQEHPVNLATLLVTGDKPQSGGEYILKQQLLLLWMSHRPTKRL